MSKPINKDTKSLDELLKQINNPDDNMDAFEQDAMEGFASLENKEEALRLKSKLDKRFEREILEKKKKPLVIYWAAAASIALLIGIFVIFKSTFTDDKESLAINETAKNAEFVQAPGSEAISQAETTTITEEEKPAKTSGKKANNDGIYSADKRSESLNEKEADDNFKQDAAKSESVADEQNQNAVPPAPADDLAKQGPGNADNKKTTTANNAASGGTSGESAKTKDADKNMEDMERKEETKSAPKARLIKKEKAKSDAAPEAATAPSQKTPSEIEGAFEKSNIGIAALTISPNDLKTKLDKFFSDKSYKKAFVCTLTINVSNQVEEVVFENKKIFKKSELKELENFLKSLKCFKSNEYSPYSTYKLSYQPQ